jgi:hypothetical protein
VPGTPKTPQTKTAARKGSGSFRRFVTCCWYPSGAKKHNGRVALGRDAVTQRGSAAPPPKSPGECAEVPPALQRSTTGVIPSPACTSATLCRPTIRRPARPIRCLPRELTARRLPGGTNKIGASAGLRSRGKTNPKKRKKDYVGGRNLTFWYQGARGDQPAARR